ncbi:hypothetical protein FHS42_001463 [Streptomyces zagrosensis]|uniref:DUF3099 domain-containing protein n=1 Tax=Streptomyces zagrosensis TaxID=1042984 RepID=A0A7W9Q6H6_9ACTN|nr:hypothetical protein [Streptomyces zagrosensis]
MYARRRRGYFLMMGACLTLFVLAWSVVRLWSIPVAVGMCVVAMVIPPFAAIVANRRGPEERWFDEPGPDPPDRPGDPISGSPAEAPPDSPSATHSGPTPGLSLWPDPARDAACDQPPPPNSGPGGGTDTGTSTGGTASSRRGARTGDKQSDAWWDELDGKHHP